MNGAPQRTAPSKQSVASKSEPILVTNCAREIRALSGEIWLVEKRDFGTQLRASINSRNIRVIVPPISGQEFLVPVEPNSATHYVKDMDGLRTWLISTCNSLTKKE